MNDDVLELEVLALRSQLESVRTMQLRGVEGMRACLEGVGKEDCPFDGAEKDAWLMGYLQQEKDINSAATIVSLRQALKAQVMDIASRIDIAEEVEAEPTLWWLEYLTDEAHSAFSGNPQHIKLYENILKSAISLVKNRAFSFNSSGIVVDNEQAELFDKFNDAVEEFLSMKGEG